MRSLALAFYKQASETLCLLWILHVLAPIEIFMTLGLPSTATLCQGTLDRGHGLAAIYVKMTVPPHFNERNYVLVLNLATTNQVASSFQFDHSV